MTDQVVQLTNEQLKTFQTIDPNLAKWATLATLILWAIQTVSSWINTSKTKKNTKALEETSPAEIAKARDEAVTAIKEATGAAVTAIKAASDEHVKYTKESTHEINTTVIGAQTEMKKEVRDFSIRVMRLSEEQKKNLSGMPKVGDAINQMNARIGQAELTAKKAQKTMDALLEGIERLKKRDG